MLYYISDIPKNRISFDLLDEVVAFGYEYLGIDDDLELEIVFTSEFEKYQTGDSDINDDGIAEINVSKRLSRKEIIATIFHELVHIKQMHRKELIMGEGFEPSTWYGKGYVGYYELLPWEEEAFRLENEMMSRFYVDIQ